MLIAILADTHLAHANRKLPCECVTHLRAAELILHAGDVSGVSVLDELCGIGPPVVAVHGNIDDAGLVERLPSELEVEVDHARLAMTHDAGPARGRAARLRKRFPRADAVVFGHSHIPLHESSEGFQIFNPGSPTDRRRQPQRTMGLARVEGRAIAFEHVALGV